MSTFNQQFVAIFIHTMCILTIHYCGYCVNKILTYFALNSSWVPWGLRFVTVDRQVKGALSVIMPDRLDSHSSTPTSLVTKYDTPLRDTETFIISFQRPPRCKHLSLLVVLTFYINYLTGQPPYKSDLIPPVILFSIIHCLDLSK